MTGYHTEEELKNMGFRAIGTDVKISRTTTIYNAHLISVGSHVRIDNFCVIAPSGQAAFRIGSYVHISAFNFLNGRADISIDDFSTTAPYARFFSSTDDYSGETLTGAVIPAELLGTFSAPVRVDKYCIIGTGTTLLPGVLLAEGTAVGAHSLVKDSSGPYTIIAGIPAAFKKQRSRAIAAKAEAFLRNRR